MIPPARRSNGKQNNQFYTKCKNAEAIQQYLLIFNFPNVLDDRRPVINYYSAIFGQSSWQPPFSCDRMCATFEFTFARRRYSDGRLHPGACWTWQTAAPCCGGWKWKARSCLPHVFNCSSITIHLYCDIHPTKTRVVVD